jgi:hypothetical protein
MATEKPDNWDDLPDGSRQDAQIDQEAERHFFVVDGKRYWFDIAEPSWKQRNQIMSNSLAIGDGEVDVKIDEYYLDMLEVMIVDSSVGVENIRTFLVGVGSELGDKLEALAPEPAAGLSEDEEGKSGERSEAADQGSEQTPA